MTEQNSNNFSNEEMILLKQLKNFLSDGTLEDLLELKKTIEGNSEESSHLDSFDFWLKRMGPNCFRLPHLRRFFLEDYGKNTASIINKLYKKWSKDYK